MNDIGDWERRGPRWTSRTDVADGYATGYLAFILLRARASEKIPAALAAQADLAYQKAFDWLLANQMRDGKWESASLNNRDPFNKSLVEDAAAAFALEVLRHPF